MILSLEKELHPLNSCILPLFPRVIKPQVNMQQSQVVTKCARRLIDIGANLTDAMFRGIYHTSQKHNDDFDLMLKRAKIGGVEKIIITGGSLDDSKKALELARLDECLYSTVGVHPTRCEEFNAFKDGPDAYLDELSKLIREGNGKVVAIGELGLDYDRLHFCSKETQRIYFEKQLILVQQTKLPLFLHNRNSTDDFLSILDSSKHMLGSAKGVVHSFDGSQSDLKRILDLGFSIGINGCSLKTEQNLEVAKEIPADKLLIETDCPWCDIRPTHASFKHIKTTFAKSKDASDPSLPVKGRNEPSNLIQILEVLASIRQEDIDQLERTIYDNTIKMFFNNE